MRQRTLNFQFKSWTIVLILVPSLLIMLIYTAFEIEVAKKEKLQLINQIVESQEGLIDYWIEERALDVRELSQADAFRNLDERQMRIELDRKQQNNKNFDSLSYISKDGYFRMSTLSKGIQFPSAIGTPYYEAALAGKNYISDVVIGRNSGLAIINFSSPIFNNEGNFQGLILGSVRMATLQTLLSNNHIGKTGQIYLVNNEGIMLTEPRNISELVEEGLVEDTAIMKIKISDDAMHSISIGGNGTATWTDNFGMRVLGAYKHIPEREWTIIGKISQEEILAPVYKQLLIMASGTILIIILMMPLATLITNRIKRPLEWLSVQSIQVAADNYNVIGSDNLPKNMPYELSKLCSTFINMSHKIESYVGLLKTKESELEHKVIDIQSINAELQKEIRERQAIEDALRAETRERENAEKLALLGIMSTGIAHEINQPLNAIKVASESILYWYKRGRDLEMSRIIDDIMSISEQAQRINQIIKNLRLLLKTDNQVKQIPVNINDVIQKVIQMTDNHITAHNILVDLTLTSEETIARMVPSAMEGIVFNLLMNSIEALNSISRKEKRIHIETRRDNDNVILKVKDNGPGISDELIDKIFDPFFSTKIKDKGMGLGLSIVQLFVEACQGSINAEKNTDGGATFRIKFPVYL